jgi:hypothetical protein
MEDLIKCCDGNPAYVYVYYSFYKRDVVTESHLNENSFHINWFLQKQIVAWHRTQGGG